MTQKTRVMKLEAQAGITQRYKYMTVIGNDCWDTPEEIAKGYKIQPYIREAGGTGGEPFYLATVEELNEFVARPDVDLLVIEAKFREPETEPEPQNESE